MYTRKQLRQRRKKHTRETVFGTADRPRLAVYRSNTALSIQLVDDEKRRTIASGRTKGKNAASAAELAKGITEQVKAKHITSIVFDRSGFRYHGVIKILADALREGGLKF